VPGRYSLLGNGRVMGVSGILGGWIDGSGRSAGAQRSIFLLGLIAWRLARRRVPLVGGGFPVARDPCLGSQVDHRCAVVWCGLGPCGPVPRSGVGLPQLWRHGRGRVSDRDEYRHARGPCGQRVTGQACGHCVTLPMDLRQLTPRYFVSPQIDVADVPALKESGITCILCNRPDSEVPPSHRAQAIRSAAVAAGLRFVDLPLTHQSMVPEVIAQNRALGVESDDVVLAYCASGTRSTIAWALGQAGLMPAEEIIAAARSAGYDLGNIKHVLQAPFA